MAPDKSSKMDSCAERGMSRVSSLGVEGSRITALETELESARREVAAAKESAAMELVVLRHQLAGVQAALSEAEQVQIKLVFIFPQPVIFIGQAPRVGLMWLLISKKTRAETALHC